MTDYILSLMAIALCFGIAAAALDTIFGQLGAFHLGGGMLFGIGAYSYALIAPWNPWIGFFVAAMLSGATSCLIALPFIHLTQRPTFLFVTLACQLFGFEVCNNAVSLTRGAAGIAGVPAPALGPLSFDSDTKKFMLTAAIVTITSVGLWMWYRSRRARIVGFVRQDEWAAAELGLVPGVIKLQALLVGGIGLGIAGSLYAIVIGFVSPRDAGLDISIAATVAVLAAPRFAPWVLTGVGAALYLLPEGARFLNSGTTSVPAIRNVLFGAVLLIIGVNRQRQS